MNEAMTLYLFFSGAVAFGFGICALFLARFWWRTRDALFLSFALAFGLLGVSHAMLAFTHIPSEERAPIYLLRLAAFALILLAIARKNRSS